MSNRPAASTVSVTGLLAEPRRRKILERLEEEGSAQVRDLSAAFGVCEATFRQSLPRDCRGGPEAGWTYPSFANLDLKATMIHAASHVYPVADSTRINRSSFTRLGALDLVNAFVTDDGISDSDAKEFERRGIELLIAS